MASWELHLSDEIEEETESVDGPTTAVDEWNMIGMGFARLPWYGLGKD